MCIFLFLFSTTGSITEAPPRRRHPRHRLIRDMSLTADFSTYNYSSDVAHLFKENRYSNRDTLNDLVHADKGKRDYMKTSIIVHVNAVIIILLLQG